MINKEKYFDALFTISNIHRGKNYRLGYPYESQKAAEYIKYCEQSITEDKEKIEQEASNGDSDAILILGICYYRGLCFEKNISKAIDLYKQSAELGNPKAKYLLSIEYGKGRHIEKDNEKSMSLLNEAAEQGVSEAQNRLAYFYQIGIEKTAEPFSNVYAYIDSHDVLNSESLQWYTKAARQDDQISQWILAHHYETQQDYQQSILWYSKSAENNNTIALYNLGYYYQQGVGTQVNIGKAIDCYKKVIEYDINPLKAYYALFLIYYDLKKYIRASETFNSIIEKEKEYSTSKHSSEIDIKYGLMCAEGLGVEQNPQKAIEYLSLGLSGYKDPKALKLLSQYYIRYGKDILKEKDQLSVQNNINIFESIANSGDADMQYRLATLYKNGLVVKKDRQRAKYWFHKSADLGNLLSKREYDNMNKSFFRRLFS